jgi:hypothetical protein
MIVIAGYDPDNAPHDSAKGKARIHPYRERARLMDMQIMERRTPPKRDKMTHRQRTNVRPLPLKSEVIMQDFTPPARQNWQRWDKDTSVSKRVKRAG